MNRLNRRLPIVFLLLFTIGLFLTGCAGSAVGIGAMSGLAAYEERSFKVIARDAKIALELRAALLQKSENLKSPPIFQILPKSPNEICNLLFLKHLYNIFSSFK